MTDRELLEKAMSRLIDVPLRLTEEQANNLIAACKQGDIHYQFEGYS